MAHVNRLYQILYPNQALVASQLSPRISPGITWWGPSAITAQAGVREIDINFRHPYFNIDEMLKQMVPHADGTPKRTKFICSYRVMEHMDFDAIKNLYLTNSEANVLELTPGSTTRCTRPVLRTYAESRPCSCW